MKLFWRFIRTDVKKSKRNFVLFGCTIFLGVIAIVISIMAQLSRQKSEIFIMN